MQPAAPRRAPTGRETKPAGPDNMLSRVLIYSALVLLSACGGGTAATGGASGYGGGSGTAPAISGYAMSKLVSDGQLAASLTDISLIDPRGIAIGPAAPVWVTNRGTHTSTIYNGIGQTQLAAVTIPAGPQGAADPTGIVYN